jgi:hypothetical protein
MTQNDITAYLEERVEDQIGYFDSSAIKNQRCYKRLKRIAILCNILTTMAIALAFTVKSPENKTAMGIVALILSTMVLATYQWEEFENYGAKWEKFRLVAEQLKSQKHLFLTPSGPYAIENDAENGRLFVETIEGIIKGTELSYFTLVLHAYGGAGETH